MNSQFYQSASYVPSDGTRAEERKRQEQWNQHQQRTHPRIHNSHVTSAASMSDIPKNPTTRKRADSHQPSSYVQPSSADQTHLRPSYEYDERPRRFSSADHGSQLSGNFNAPTEIELERERENRKSLKGLEKVRSKVKRLVGS